MIAIADQISATGAHEQPDVAAPGARCLSPEEMEIAMIVNPLKYVGADTAPQLELADPAVDPDRPSPEEIARRLDPERARADEEAFLEIVRSMATKASPPVVPPAAAPGTPAATASAEQVPRAATPGGQVQPAATSSAAVPLAARLDGGFTGLNPQAEEYLAIEVASTSLSSPDPAHPMMAPAAVRRRNQAMIRELLNGNGSQAILASQVIQLQTCFTRAIAGMEQAQDATDRAMGAVSVAKIAKATAEHLHLLDRLQRPRKRRAQVAKVEVQRGGQAIVGDVHVGAK